MTFHYFLSLRIFGNVTQIVVHILAACILSFREILLNFCFQICAAIFVRAVVGADLLLLVHCRPIVEKG